MNVNPVQTTFSDSPTRPALKKELKLLSVQGRNMAVYHLCKNIPSAKRSAYRSTSIIHSVTESEIEKIEQEQRATPPGNSVDYDAIFSEVECELVQFIHCADRKPASRELFECLLAWSEVLAARNSGSEEAMQLLDRAVALNIRVHPDLQARLLLLKSELLFEAGRYAEARQELSSAAACYYLIPDRNLVSAVILLLGKVSLLTGEARHFRELLFSGLRHFYTRGEVRRLCTGLLRKTYRNAFRLLLDRDIRTVDKALFLGHLLDHQMHESGLGRRFRLDRLTRKAVLAGVYFLNYAVWSGRPPRPGPTAKGQGHHFPGPAGGNRRRILVTRAMGGIGDLLMMTPGLHALKLEFPNYDLHLAIPREYAPLFIGNKDIEVLDIEAEAIDLNSYEKWFNLTDCPAARVESRTMPRVTRSRIDIFSQSFGIKGRRLRGMDRRPRYFISEAEEEFRREFWERYRLSGKTVIGLQLRAAESYRDYPHMPALVGELANEGTVIVFHNEKITIETGETVIDPGPLSLRQAFALAGGCSVIVAPDSSFVHFAASQSLPCVALYGPIDGRVRTGQYPATIAVDASAVLQCIPCWRNEVIPCQLTNMRESACMGNIAVSEIMSAVRLILKEKG